MSVNSRLKAIQIIGQRKAFYRQKIPESSCARKETVDTDVLVTSRNGDRKIMQSIITSGPPSVNYFYKKAPSQMFDQDSNMPLLPVKNKEINYLM